MFPTKKSTITFILLILLLGILVVLNTYLPQGEMGQLMEQAGPLKMPKWQIALGGAGITIVLYGILGFIGMILSKKVGIPEIWAKEVTNKNRFLIPAVIGSVCGVLIIIGDLIFRNINGFGSFIHPPFPTSIVASLSAGIGEELIFELFFISFWTWLMGKVILRGHGFKIVYWVVSVLSAIAFGAGHFPSLMIMTGAKSFAEFSPILIAEVILLNGVVGIMAAYLFKKSGYLAAIGVHFWTDMIWHVVYGLI